MDEIRCSWRDEIWLAITHSAFKAGEISIEKLAIGRFCVKIICHYTVEYKLEMYGQGLILLLVGSVLTLLIIWILQLNFQIKVLKVKSIFKLTRYMQYISIEKNSYAMFIKVTGTKGYESLEFFFNCFIQTFLLLFFLYWYTVGMS